MFYDEFIRLCSEKGVSPSSVMVSIGSSKANLKRWREGVEPTNYLKRRVADYFGVPVSELTQGKIKKPTLPPESELSETDKEFIRLLREATPEQIQRVRDFVAGVLASR